MLFALLSLFGLLLASQAQAQVGCVPNPNVNGPPFIDGCEIPAAGLNAGFSAQAAGVCENILSFGGNKGGSVANDTAFASAITAGVSGKPCVYFPTGTYKFASGISLSLAAAGNVATLYGDAPDSSTLLFAGTAGITVNETNASTAAHIRDLSVSPSSSGGTGIFINSTVHTGNMASSSIDRVRIGDPIGGNFYANGVELSGLSTTNLSGLDIWAGLGASDPASTGTKGIYLVNATGNLGFVFNIDKTNVYGAEWGLYYGPGVQGVTIQASNFVLNHFGIYVSAAGGSTAQAQLSIVNDQFDNYNDNILVDTGSNLSHLQAINNLFFLVTGTNGVHILAGGEDTISANHFVAATGGGALQTSTSGLNITNGAQNTADGNLCIDITPCIMINNPAAGWRIYDTEIDGQANEVPIQNNSFAGANLIVGNADSGAASYPQGNPVTGAANDGGLIRLTLANTMTTLNQFITDQVLFCNVPGLTNGIGLYKATVIDTTHIDLQGSAFSGSLTSNGTCFASR
jgi:hypothetical protein